MLWRRKSDMETKTCLLNQTVNMFISAVNQHGNMGFWSQPQVAIWGTAVFDTLEVAARLFSTHTHTQMVFVCGLHSLLRMPLHQYMLVYIANSCLMLPMSFTALFIHNSPIWCRNCEPDIYLRTGVGRLLLPLGSCLFSSRHSYLFPWVAAGQCLCCCHCGNFHFPKKSLSLELQAAQNFPPTPRS